MTKDRAFFQFMLPPSLRTTLAQATLNQEITVMGWVKHKRIGKKVGFLALQDGSMQDSLQLVLDVQQFGNQLQAIGVGASLKAEGYLRASSGKEQGREVEVANFVLLGGVADDYPLQPKPHSLTFLRGLQHLRFRTNTFQAVFRLRHLVAYAVHRFFHKKGFSWFHTPLMTSIDGEGAGALFGVEQGVKKKKSFFGKKMYLTVSGQLAAEAGAMGLGKVYTFGPTFRAESSHTRHHLAEFWMVEPEMAFYTLDENIALAQECLQYLVAYALEHGEVELAFLETLHKKRKAKNELPLCKKLTKMVEGSFMRLTYTEAVDVLQQASKKAPGSFNREVVWGDDLQTEEERYLTSLYQGGVIVTDYPAAIKAFYMRQNRDGKSVAAMDFLLPGIGEVVGGSQREERHDYLVEAIKRKGIDQAAMQWYLDGRRFGSVPHSGFGIGFERLLQFITGMENIRDVIPFPRAAGEASC